MASPIELSDVAFGYGAAEFGFEVPSLRIEGGRRVACVGPSGCGKTTLAHLICGILVPQRGQVRFGELEVSALSDRQRRAMRSQRVGLMFQQFELLEYLSVRDNVLLPYHISPALQLDDRVRERAEELLSKLGIRHTADRPPHQLSQGEQQRVAIGRALVAEPDLLICDEPTGNLDPQTAGVALDLLFEQAAAHGATLFLVTHDHSLLPRFDEVLEVTEIARPLRSAGRDAGRSADQGAQ